MGSSTTVAIRHAVDSTVAMNTDSRQPSISGSEEGEGEEVGMPKIPQKRIIKNIRVQAVQWYCTVVKGVARKFSGGGQARGSKLVRK